MCYLPVNTLHDSVGNHLLLMSWDHECRFLLPIAYFRLAVNHKQVKSYISDGSIEQVNLL